jgi:Fe-S oxidoreductase
MSLEQIAILVIGLAGAVSFSTILWNRRLKHVWPKRKQIKIVNPKGFFTGSAEIILQTRVIANRPIVGIMHLLVFYGFVTFGAKSITHVYAGFTDRPTPIGLGPLDGVLDVFAVLVLLSCIGLAIRRYTIMRHRLTHMVESGIVLSMIAGLMVTYILEVDTFGVHLGISGNTGAEVNWWVHYLIICSFPSLIAYGKHLHLIMGPVNVVLKHMVELPGDRAVAGADLDMGDENTPEEHFEAELIRVGMPNGVADFSFHTLFDPAACIECGRCNDACPSADAGLKPREHFVLAFRDPSTNTEALAELTPADVISTCTQCRACDAVCPVGNRPARAGLELRGRMTAEGLYPPRALKEGGSDRVTAAGNIFAGDPSDRAQFIEGNNIPYFQADEHDVLFALGCQGGHSPEAQPVVVATARLLEAAGIKYGVLKEESCWGEGLLHGGGIMEDWPFYKMERVMELSEALTEQHDRTILTICPHCKDNIGVQLSNAAEGMKLDRFANVVSHVSFLKELLDTGKIEIEKKAETMAVHHPCKTIHNDETADFDALLDAAGVTGKTAGKSPAVPSCCGGGGGGFLWDSPAKVSQNRWKSLEESTGESKVVTGCPGCHRMLGVAKSEEGSTVDIANLVYERLKSNVAELKKEGQSDL